MKSNPPKNEGRTIKNIDESKNEIKPKNISINFKSDKREGSNIISDSNPHIVI